MFAEIASIGTNLALGSASLSSSKSLAKKQLELQKRALALQESAYEDWQATFGSIRDNLSTFYTNLSPEYYATAGREAFQQQYEAALTSLDENLASRGITTSTLGASNYAELEVAKAKELARIETEAPMQVAQAKQNFLSIGMGADPTQAYSATASQFSQQYGAQANQASQAAGAYFGEAANVGITALADYERSIDSTPTSYNMAGGPV